MADISREKLEAYIELSEKLIEDSPEPFPKFNNARFYELSFLRDAIRSGELDADPWIPVSTPPIDQQALGKVIDEIYALYMPEPAHSGWNKALDAMLGELVKLKSPPPK